MDSSTILLLFICLATGVLAGLLFGLYRGKATSRVSGLTKEVDQLTYQIDLERERNISIKNEAESLKKELNHLREEKENAAVRASRLAAEKEALEKKLTDQQAEMEKAQERLNKDFQLLANKIFEEKSEKFTLQNRESIDRILNPLREKLAEFEKKVEDTHKDSLKETSGLRQEIKTLREMSAKMTTEAENLTNALRNDTKIQGNWGEMILENILESSGLRKDQEYFLQNTFSSEGQRRRPDVMIKLPDNKWVIIDSKVSLKAYEDFVNEGDDLLRERSKKAHLTSIRAHISGLAKKQYHEFAEGKNLDFILMFIPVEPAYLMALHDDHSIFNSAYEQGIVMVSPTTLIASLKIIATSWKHEHQNQNAQQIAERGKKLLEKFTNFAENFEKVGEQLDRTSRTYQDAMNQLRDGRGSLVSQARKLEELGVKSPRKLSDNLLQSGDD